MIKLENHYSTTSNAITESGMKQQPLSKPRCKQFTGIEVITYILCHFHSSTQQESAYNKQKHNNNNNNTETGKTETKGQGLN